LNGLLRKARRTITSAFHQGREVGADRCSPLS
jgi:hypothetical protein